MVGFKALAAGIAIAAGCVAIANAETLTIATVNNDDRAPTPSRTSLACA
jgi:hypothetical protein